MPMAEVELISAGLFDNNLPKNREFANQYI